MVDSFAGYSTLGLFSWFFMTWNVLLCLPSFQIFCWEISCYDMYIYIYIIHDLLFFSLTAFNIVSLFYILSVWTMICRVICFSGLAYLAFCMLLVHVWVYISTVWVNFLLWYHWRSGLCIDLGYFSLFYFYYLKVGSFHGVLHFLYVLFLCLDFFYILCLFHLDLHLSLSLDISSSKWFISLIRLLSEFSIWIIDFSIPSLFKLESSSMFPYLF